MGRRPGAVHEAGPVTVVRVLVLQMERFRWHLNQVAREHESRIVSDGGGPLAVLLPCLPDGTVDHDVVEEHNREAGSSAR